MELTLLPDGTVLFTFMCSAKIVKLIPFLQMLKKEFLSDIRVIIVF